LITILHHHHTSIAEPSTSPDKAAGVIHTNKESQKRDPSGNLLQDIGKYKEIMREWAEFQDLARRIRAT